MASGLGADPGRPSREGLDRVDRVARQGNRPEAYLLAGQTALKMNEFERARDYADAAAAPESATARRGHFARHRAQLPGRHRGRHSRRCERPSRPTPRISTRR